MRPRVLAWVVAAVFLPLLGAESAFATDSPAGTQAISQCACSQQSADASATSTQTKPTNQNISVNVLSPGDTGPVTQVNSSAAAAAAGNKNTTDQTASQDPPSGGGTQVIGQQAGNDQSASATSTSTQDHPTNQNISVHVLSPGTTGPVTQVNSSAALAAAGNSNDTSQTANQTAGGGPGQQVVDQSAKNEQSADATATSTQDHPKNQNIQVNVLSPGSTGPVTQVNSSAAAALAGNKNSTDQSADQTAGGGGGGQQVIGQSAKSYQSADATATSTQDHPTNQNISVHVLSPGDTGPVTQINGSAAVALAGNANSTTQSASQDPTCGCGGGGATQVIDQQAFNKQDASSDATSTQKGAENTNIPLSVGDGYCGCGGKKDDKSDPPAGSVTQVNFSGALAAAGNKNSTDQSADQTLDGGSGSATQAILQVAGNKQDASATADSKQIHPTNTNTPVSLSGDCGCGGKKEDGKQDYGKQDYGKQDYGKQDYGKQMDCGCGGSDGSYAPSKGGDVTQANISAAAGLAGNKNETSQSATQDPKGYDGGTAVQQIGQVAFNKQDASADADSKQIHPTNTNAPVGGSGGGDVTQVNFSGALAAAGNENSTDQSATQTLDGSGYGSGTAVQAIGQLAGSKQDASADGTSDQWYPTNTNTPVGGGGGGDVTQANVSAAAGLAGNKNETDQSASQDPTCGCGGGSTTVQAIGQAAFNKQDASGYADSTQKGAQNTNAPVSYGGDCGCGGKKDYSSDPAGDVTQLNVSGALAAAGNKNSTDQSADQTLDGSGSGGGTAVQAIGQLAGSKQDASADATSDQWYPTNTNTPVSYGGGGGGGDVTQANVSAAAALAGNKNETDQSASQDPKGYGDGTAIQAIGQVAFNKQDAYANADSTQVQPTNTNAPVSFGGDCGCGGKKDDKSDPPAGSVTQVNFSGALAAAGNKNSTDQSADQTLDGGSGSASQTILQIAGSKQDASADATSNQWYPSNTNAPVFLGFGDCGCDSYGKDGGYDKKPSCGCGGGSSDPSGGGSVTQANLSAALGLAGNHNSTDQSANQYLGGSGQQVIAQKAFNFQDANAKADSTQYDPTNSNFPIWGGGGSVTQLNASLAFALAGNLNKAKQEADQTQP